jgi:hypothetical protein
MTVLHLQREKASRLPFSLTIWNSVGVNQTAYPTYPTQIYTFQLNVWARWCAVVHLLPYHSKLVKIWYVIKAET